MVTEIGHWHKESKPIWKCTGILRWLLLALREIKVMLLADGATAIERGWSRWSISLNVMNPASKRNEETLFCPQIYKQIQKNK